jgi:UDP-N-acetylmuramate: L-alanyl-gamma-D-glutamyl-meso-diaminopimelate ligase
MRPEGVFAVCADSPAALEVTEGTRARRITYGLGAGEFRAAGLSVDAGGAHFSIQRGGKAVSGAIRLSIGGRMNVANALGVAALLSEFGLSMDGIGRGFESFRGVVRRQELIGEPRGVAVIDDFAHHPTAIRATLAAVAERFPGRRILAAFEPRSNTARRNIFQAEFATAFDLAARVYLGSVYFKDNDPIAPEARLSIEALAADIARRGPAAFACASTDEVLTRIIADAGPGDVVLVMSNGPFDNLKERLLAELEKPPA